VNETPDQKWQEWHRSCGIALDAWCVREGVDGDTYFRLSRRLHQWYSKADSRGASGDDITDLLLKFLSSVEDLGYDQMADKSAEMAKDVRARLSSSDSDDDPVQ
jgi:hypothetical protein